MIIPNSVVLFTEIAAYEAGKFCHERGIAGTVVAVEQTAILVDAGLGYMIYAQPGDVMEAPPGTEPGVVGDVADAPIIVDWSDE